jgi:hypothetical protein
LLSQPRISQVDSIGRSLTDQDIGAIPAGLELDIAVEKAVMPGNINFDQFCNSPRLVQRHLIAHYSTDMQAAWQVIQMVRGWNFYHRQRFLVELWLEVSKANGFSVSEYELLWNTRAEHVCRAALKALRTVAEPD